MATLGARSGGSNEARVPCPLCGGLIHPIAGKCKHCKADLSSYRAQRPHANAQLPSLGAVAQAVAAHAVAPASAPVAVPPIASPAPSNGHQPVTTPDPQAVLASPWAPPQPSSAYAPAPVVVPGQPPPSLAAMHEQAAQPILPQRPTGMSWTHMQKQAPQPSPWRSWPMLVIILAMVAIVAAVVIMVWPSDKKADAKSGLGSPPASDHMNTKPSTSNDDPWGPSSSQLDPPASSGAKRPVLAQISEHACNRVLACSDHALPGVCDGAAPSTVPAACQPAASKCMAHIDSISCSSMSSDALEGLLAQVPECVEAIHC